VYFFNLRWGDVDLNTSSDGLEYLQLNERQTKTRSGANIADVRGVIPKMFATNDNDRCPIRIYKSYASQRPADFCNPDDPFYIAPRTGNQVKTEIPTEKWFIKAKVGQKK